MFSINEIDPNKYCSAELALHNMRTSEQWFHLELFVASAFGWLEANPGKNFQDLERTLREHDYETHLCAKLPESEVTLSFDRSPKTYEIIFCCRPKIYARREVEVCSGSYEENFRLLADTGYRVVNEGDITDTDSTRVFGNDERSCLNMLAHNRAMLFFTDSV